MLRYVLGGKEALLRRALGRLLADEFLAIRREFVNAEPLRQVFDQIAQLPYLGWIRSGEIPYVIVRALKPKVVVETGVAAGLSTACILAALEQNGLGELHSIDLPNYERAYLSALSKEPSAILPKDKSPGFLVPEGLRSRWHLHLGNSCDLLPHLLSKLRTLNLFLHDSEHTYGTMIFEYETAWLHLEPGGILLSDDVGWNDAFPDFCQRYRLSPVYFWFPGLGGVAKPSSARTNPEASNETHP